MKHKLSLILIIAYTHISIAKSFNKVTRVDFYVLPINITTYAAVNDSSIKRMNSTRHRYSNKKKYIRYYLNRITEYKTMPITTESGKDIRLLIEVIYKDGTMDKYTINKFKIITHNGNKYLGTQQIMNKFWNADGSVWW